MTTKIFSNYVEFLLRYDRAVNGISEGFAKSHPNYETMNETNAGCWNCTDCTKCTNCSRCTKCTDCANCSDCDKCTRCTHCTDCMSLNNMTKETSVK